MRIGNDSPNGGSGCRDTVFGDHAQFVNGKAVVRRAGTHGSTYFVAYEFYVMAYMQVEINTAGGDLENLT